MTFYEGSPVRPADLQQGDVLKNIPFSYFVLQRAQLSGVDEAVDPTVSDYSGSDVIARLEYGYGILLSQTCDMQAVGVEPDAPSRKPLLVARAKPVEEVIKAFTEAKAIEAIKRLKNPGESPALFYLPAIVGGEFALPRLVVDLLDIQRYGPENLPAIKSKLYLRLSVPALQALQERCAYCFGRYAAPDDLFYSAEEAEQVRAKQAESARKAAEKLKAAR